MPMSFAVMGLSLQLPAKARWQLAAGQADPCCLLQHLARASTIHSRSCRQRSGDQPFWRLPAYQQAEFTLAGFFVPHSPRWLPLYLARSRRFRHILAVVC